MKIKTLREEIAQAIWAHQGGVAPDEFETVMGKPKGSWDALTEWQRDDYRFEADAVLDVLKKHKITDA